MIETIKKTGQSKIEQYQNALLQIEQLIQDENSVIAAVGNTLAALHYEFNWWWTGIYIVKNGQLVLGPFQGPVACTTIAFNRGVCGACYTQQKSIIVPNVEEFPGHIACSAESKSEIVLPINYNGEIIAVLDVDSQYLNSFDADDEHYLTQVADLLAPKILPLVRI